MSTALATQVQVGKRKLSLSNLNKVLYPAAGFTKGQVIDYYTKIAPVLLKHLDGRPITLKRYPNGVDSIFFYEKRCPSHRPDWVTTADVWSEGNNDHLRYCIVDDRPTLVWIANLASIELHTLLAKAGDTSRPTMMVFDFDPGPPANILDCIRVALRFREILEHLGLKSFPKTSGGKGLHLYVPLNTAVTFEQTKAFSKALAQLLEKEDPQHVTHLMRKDLRTGKVFVDWSQNSRHKTTVAPYSLRARPHPTVSTPVTWDEVEAGADGEPLSFEASDVLARIEDQGDLFAHVLTTKQDLPKS